MIDASFKLPELIHSLIVLIIRVLLESAHNLNRTFSSSLVLYCLLGYHRSNLDVSVYRSKFSK